MLWAWYKYQTQIFIKTRLTHFSPSCSGIRILGVSMPITQRSTWHKIPRFDRVVLLFSAALRRLYQKVLLSMRRRDLVSVFSSFTSSLLAVVYHFSWCCVSNGWFVNIFSPPVPWRRENCPELTAGDQFIQLCLKNTKNSYQIKHLWNFSTPKSSRFQGSEQIQSYGELPAIQQSSVLDGHNFFAWSQLFKTVLKGRGQISHLPDMGTASIMQLGA